MMNRNVLLAKKLFIQAANAGGLDEQTALAELEAAMGAKSIGAVFASFFAGQRINNTLANNGQTAAQNRDARRMAIQMQYVAVRDSTIVAIQMAEQGDQRFIEAMSALSAAVNSFMIQVADSARASEKGRKTQRVERQKQIDWVLVDPIIMRVDDGRKSNEQIANIVSNELKIEVSKESIRQRRKNKEK